MWRFVLKENIRRFRVQIENETSAAKRDTLRSLLADAEAELAELESASTPEAIKGDARLAMFAEHAIDEAMKLHGAQFGILQVYDEGLCALQILAQKNFRAEYLRPFAFIDPDEGSVSGRCFKKGRTITVEDVNNDPSFEPRRQTATEGGFEAVQSSPLRSGDLVIGVLSTHFTKPQQFSPRDVQRMDRYSSSIGAELHRYLRAIARTER
jgi:hypothetical protein